MCVLTYDTSLTFYSVAQSGEITLMHVGEVDDPFIPLPLSRLMMDVTNNRESIDIVIDKIYNMFTSGVQGQAPTSTRAKFSNQVCTGAAVSACSKLLEGNGKFYRTLKLLV